MQYSLHFSLVKAPAPSRQSLLLLQRDVGFISTKAAAISMAREFQPRDYESGCSKTNMAQKIALRAGQSSRKGPVTWLNKNSTKLARQDTEDNQNRRGYLVERPPGEVSDDITEVGKHLRFGRGGLFKRNFRLCKGRACPLPNPRRRDTSS